MEFKAEGSQFLSVQIQQPKVIPSLEFLSSSFVSSNARTSVTHQDFYSKIAKDIDEIIVDIARVAIKLRGAAASVSSELIVNFEMVSPQLVLLWDFASKGTILEIFTDIKFLRHLSSILETLSSMLQRIGKSLYWRATLSG